MCRSVPPTVGTVRRTLQTWLAGRMLTIPHGAHLASMRPAILNVGVQVAEAVRRLGPILQQGYGMAEVLPPISLLRPQEHGVLSAPAGPEVLRSAGRVVPQGQVRSAAMCSGHWNAPDPPPRRSAAATCAPATTAPSTPRAGCASSTATSM